MCKLSPSSLFDWPVDGIKIEESRPEIIQMLLTFGCVESGNDDSVQGRLFSTLTCLSSELGHSDPSRQLPGFLKGF